MLRWGAVYDAELPGRPAVGALKVGKSPAGALPVAAAPRSKEAVRARGIGGGRAIDGQRPVPARHVAPRNQMRVK